MAWSILYLSLELFKWLVLARVIISWVVAPHSRNPLVDFIRRLTDPILRPISEIMPPLGGFDLSPIVAFFAISIVQRVIINLA